RLAAALLQVVGLMLCGKKVLANAGVLVHFSSVFEYTCVCVWYRYFPAWQAFLIQIKFKAPKSIFYSTFS
ncbi:MAG TPA: hypothetical protein PLV36_18210, partial [Zoogloea sp.]|nr:hypothetical protein [Zoogloea sp.]